jgi:hypothetical protein
VAAPALKRYAWPAAAALAAAAIAALALSGSRPEPGLVRFEAAGVMLHIAPERVREVRVTAGGRQWQFTRARADEWRRIEGGLRLLHVSAPQRVMARDEFAGTPAAEFGLDPPRYTVSVHTADADAFVVQFGSANAQGLAQYARISGRGELFLLPRFVGAEWEAAMGLR